MMVNPAKHWVIGWTLLFGSSDSLLHGASRG
jgi:hypothetical protein